MSETQDMVGMVDGWKDKLKLAGSFFHHFAAAIVVVVVAIERVKRNISSQSISLIRFACVRSIVFFRLSSTSIYHSIDLFCVRFFRETRDCTIDIYQLLITTS